MRDRYILVCNPQRTGSTLVYNFFRECTEGFIVKKYEISPMNFVEGVDFAPVLFRHPAAVMGSLFDFLRLDPDDINFNNIFNKIEREFEWASNLLKEFPKSSYELRYENFYENTDYLVKWTKDKLSYNCNPLLVKEFCKNYSISKVKDIVKDNRNPEENLFQPNHISCVNGNDDKRILNLRLNDYNRIKLSTLCKRYGYNF